MKKNRVIPEIRIENMAQLSCLTRAISRSKRLKNGCIVFTGSRNWQGYGQIAYPPGSHIAAHRGAWLLLHGFIPEGMMVLHQCDNPPCINPEHLFLGTAADNMDDCITKGRTNSHLCGRQLFTQAERGAASAAVAECLTRNKSELRERVA